MIEDEGGRSAPVVPLERRLALSVPNAARVAGLPQEAVRRAVDDGSLRHFTLPGSSKRYVRRAELDDWVATL